MNFVSTMSNEEVREEMFLIREADSLGKSIRTKLKIPSKVRLLECQVDTFRGEERVFIHKDGRELLGDPDGLNVDEVNPFIIPFGFGHWERAGIRKNGYTIVVQLCTIVTPLAELEAKTRKEYQEKMMEEKKAGTYNENTYKKYKYKIENK